MAIGRNVRSLAAAFGVVLAVASNAAQAQNWDGSGLIRFGVFLQGQLVDYDIIQRPANAPTFRQSSTPDGVGVGISAGYDLRLGSFVIGGEIDGSFDDGGDKTRPLLAPREQYGVDFFATARARLGVLLHPDWLVYGTVGYAAQGVEYKANALGAAGKKFGTLDGIVYGGGIEWDMGWGISFFEYLHTDLSGWSFRAAGLGGNLIDLEGGSSDVFRLGMKFKVGHDYSHDVYRRPAPGPLK